MESIKNRNLTHNIVIAMFLGIVTGLILSAFGGSWTDTYLIDGLFQIGGKIFIKLLKMLVVPLVFFSLIEGVTSLSDLKELGRVGSKTLVFYLATTAIAITIALILALIAKPGEGIELVTSSTFSSSEAPKLTEIIINLFPSNPLKSMTEANMLQVIVFAIILGLGINIQGKRAQTVSTFVSESNKVIMTVLGILMAFAPFGVFCLIANVFATLGFKAFIPLAKYFIIVILALVIHVLFVYTSILKIVSGLSPITFIKKIREVWLYAFSTASSSATLPITLKTVEEKLGVHNKIASFSIPLGATINMDGTAIMQGVATIFIAQAYNIDMTVIDMLMVILTATLASIGTAGVPGVGLITLTMVLHQVGLPVEGIGLIMGIDRLLDMVRTAVNITGDATVSCIVAKSENAIDLDIYNTEQED